jgi:hypothetical protein
VGLIPLIAARHQRYWWHYNEVPDPHTEDTSHGNVDMSYLNVLRRSFG